jgi:hypothetical protein
LFWFVFFSEQVREQAGTIKELVGPGLVGEWEEEGVKEIRMEGSGGVVSDEVRMEGKGGGVEGERVRVAERSIHSASENRCWMVSW